ncbi:11336_t:CDS:1, partial [Paraglomus brasilianum]
NTNTISALRASNLALIEELTRKLGHYVPSSGIALTLGPQMTTRD